jgi:hypothetical protein
VFTDTVSSIAFDDTGTLYAVTADNAAQPETLFTVNLTTAALTLVVALGNGDLGEAIAFNPVNGLMYHTSGFSAPIAYETIDLTTLAVAPAGTLNANDTYSAFFYDAATSNFVAGTLGARYGTIGVAGGFSQINSTMSSSIRGIVIVPPVVPTVLSSTQNLNLGTTTAGTAGAAVNFTVEGFQLSANLTVTAFPGVQVSLMAATGYGASVSLVPAAGTVATTTVYARISSGTAQGAVAGNIVVTSTGANTINIAANGQVDPVPAGSSSRRTRSGSTLTGGAEGESRQRSLRVAMATSAPAPTVVGSARPSHRGRARWTIRPSGPSPRPGSSAGRVRAVALSISESIASPNRSSRRPPT